MKIKNRERKSYLSISNDYDETKKSYKVKLNDQDNDLNTFRVRKVNDFELWESGFLLSIIPFFIKTLSHILPENKFFHPNQNVNIEKDDLKKIE